MYFGFFIFTSNNKISHSVVLLFQYFSKHSPQQLRNSDEFVGEILYCLLIKMRIMCYQLPYHNCLHANNTSSLVSPKLCFSAGDDDKLIVRRPILLLQSPWV